MKDYLKKHTLVTGTIILTCAGFITRILGFFYRIFLSRTIGAEGLGLYNMIHPIYGICFAVCAGSIQTAISQFVASNVAKGKAILRTGLVISLSMSLALVLLISKSADFLATYILLEPRCAPLLPLLAMSVPFSAIHACINGYYFGIQKTKVPSFAQVFEQMIRISIVFLIANIMTSNGQPITVKLAVIGHLIGEAASCLYTMVCFSFFSPVPQSPKTASIAHDFFKNANPLMIMALPLIGNRLVLNILASAEAVWIPSRLIMSGLTNSQSLSIYGVLTGMAFPFILFPSAITNSMAVLLLPTVAEAQSAGNENRIHGTITMSTRYSLYMGIFCIGIFILFGSMLGNNVFQNKDAGTYITILAWLCPFLYLATTMGSILNGLGKTSATFANNVIALIVRLGFVLFGIPRFGIFAYLIGMLVSELLLALLHLHSLYKEIPFSWNSWEMIVKPSFVLVVSIGIYYAFFSFFPVLWELPKFIDIIFRMGFLSLCYCGFLLLLHISKRQLQSPS